MRRSCSYNRDCPPGMAVDGFPMEGELTDLLFAAGTVVSEQSRRPWERPAQPAPRKEMLKLAERVALLATEDDELFAGQLGGLPFEGVSRARLRLVREALHGYPVRYETVNDELYGRTEPQLGVFTTIRMPGEWSIFHERAYDLIIATSLSDDRTACGSGTQHVLGVGALASLEVLSADPWGWCERCFCWRPAEFLHVPSWIEPEELAEYGERRECRRQSAEGYCR